LFQCRIIEETSSAKSLTGIEPPNVGIKIRLIIQQLQGAFGKNAKNVPYNSLAVALCISGGEATAIAVERAVR
jgi:hypothetical protein